MLKATFPTMQLPHQLPNFGQYSFMDFLNFILCFFLKSKSCTTDGVPARFTTHKRSSSVLPLHHVSASSHSIAESNPVTSSAASLGAAGTASFKLFC
jgi:hypothetical protein